MLRVTEKSRIAISLAGWLAIVILAALVVAGLFVDMLFAVIDSFTH